MLEFPRNLHSPYDKPRPGWPEVAFDLQLPRPRLSPLPFSPSGLSMFLRCLLFHISSNFSQSVNVKDSSHHVHAKSTTPGGLTPTYHFLKYRVNDGQPILFLSQFYNLVLLEAGDLS